MDRAEDPGLKCDSINFKLQKGGYNVMRIETCAESGWEVG